MKLGDNTPASAQASSAIEIIVPTIGVLVGLYGLWLAYNLRRKGQNPRKGIITAIVGFGFAILFYVVTGLIFVDMF